MICYTTYTHNLKNYFCKGFMILVFTLSKGSYRLDSIWQTDLLLEPNADVIVNKTISWE